MSTSIACHHIGPRAALLFLLFLVMLTSCTTATLPLPPVSTKTRSLIGSSVAIGVRPTAVQPNVQTPFLHYRSGPSAEDRLVEAGVQAKQGFKDGAAVGTSLIQGKCLHGQGCLILIAVALAAAAPSATIGSFTGLISGALSGTPPPLRPEIGSAVDAAGVPDALRDRTYNVLQSLPHPRFLMLSYPNDYTDAHPAPLYESLLVSGAQSFLELSIESMQFIGTANDGPHELAIIVNSRLWQAKEFQLIDLRSWEYRTEGYFLNEWRANNAGLLGAKLDDFYTYISERVKHDLFAPYPN